MLYFPIRLSDALKARYMYRFQNGKSPTWSILRFNTSLKGSLAGIVSTTDVLTASDCTSNLPPDIDRALYFLANLLLGQKRAWTEDVCTGYIFYYTSSFCCVLFVFLLVFNEANWWILQLNVIMRHNSNTLDRRSKSATTVSVTRCDIILDNKHKCCLIMVGQGMQCWIRKHMI